MAKSTHDKELERARARREAERAERKKARTLVVALVAVLVTGAMVLAVTLLARNDDAPEIADPISQDADDEATDDASDGAAAATTAASPCQGPEGDVPEPSLDAYDEQPTVELGDVTTVTATLTTSCGVVTLELDAAGAPNTVNNFVALAEDGYYDGVGFHRVINGFMIQGGDPVGSGAGCLDESCDVKMPGYTFADELDVAQALVDEQGLYPRGTLAMANAGPDTNGSQFFIVQEDPGYALSPAYTVFGKVLTGLDVVDRISLGPANNDLAVDPVIILSVDIDR